MLGPPRMPARPALRWAPCSSMWRPQEWPWCPLPAPPVEPPRRSLGLSLSPWGAQSVVTSRALEARAAWQSSAGLRAPQETSGCTVAQVREHAHTCALAHRQA